MPNLYCYPDPIHTVSEMILASGPVAVTNKIHIFIDNTINIVEVICKSCKSSIYVILRLFFLI